ncbi:hypothetical protein FRZ67_20090 [Panacibacter ginsenosidivorans]|uniref:Uncharacterized protein n=2 Tax=Panacibacter ginsenosidivorans TaxID=1813871 RepID=A0A5B8VE05_9BACT|nr:hypothetical protein FRZ67_20090 [Panacibacter ginsenosidivorans]
MCRYEKIATLMFSLAGITPVIWMNVTSTDRYKFIALGILIIFIFVLLIVLSSILLPFEKTRPYGKSALLSAAIVLLIGLSVCTL